MDKITRHYGLARAPFCRHRMIRRARQFATGVALLALAACASLPTNGPTASLIRRDAENAKSSQVPFTLVDITAETVRQHVVSENHGVSQMVKLGEEARAVRADLVRPGDTLNIAIYEVGVSLFSGSPAGLATTTTPSRTPTAGGQSFAVQVREDGFIDLPYIGRIRAAGGYPEELASMIREKLRQMSESPDVTVNILDSLRNAVYIEGAVSRSGRYRLSAAHERLLDAIALAGGSPVDANDLQVHLSRGDMQVTARLNQILPGDPANILLHPGDRIELERVRETYTAFGATGKVAEIPFEAKQVTLAEAIARVEGPADYRANPRAVFLFRLGKEADGQPHAIVYHLDMMKSETYFLAQMFQVQDKDVILIANSKSNMLQKMTGLLSQLFSPALAVRYASQ